MCVLSKEKADRFKVWDEISAACERDELIEGVITARVKGGLSVTIRGGVKAFLPGSQVDLRPVRNLDAFLGQNFKFKVIKFNKKRGNIVLSRRVLLEKERAALKESTLERLKEGQIVEGIVKNLTEYGAFIDLGGIDGLLHITDMSWGRVNHPSELFQVGDHVRVKVLKFNADTERVSLGLKQITRRSVESAAEKYVPGTVVARQGRLAQGLRRVHRARARASRASSTSREMSWTRRVKHPSKMVAVGDMVEAVVLDVDVKQNRISLGMKQLEPNPYEQLTEKYPPGTVVQGPRPQHRRLRYLRGDRGRHRRPGSHQRHELDPAREAPVGAVPEGRRGRGGRSSTSTPATATSRRSRSASSSSFGDPWDRIPYDYPAGKVVDGKVLKVLDFGAFVELEKGVEGLVHVSRDQRRARRGSAHGAEAGPGREGPGAPRRRCGAQDRPVDQGREPRARSSPRRRATRLGNAGGATLGDKFRGKLKGLQKTDNE